ncbi:hypothetical protein Tsubulata_022391 [Turnera subulata]|uniref:Probable UDP-N-acetylglucosamine--peptide N-acetylglucosaminyltransferase SPINDLY n=1 Tax=Turnera subulata TaxID=218843 RepID=A0A9Q0IXC2_9ROSI|nr:hypothetical protein Tsubulata_022391 [Turnera subulata]
MISLQNGPARGGAAFASARDDADAAADFQVKLEPQLQQQPSSSSLSLVSFKGRDSQHEVDEETHLSLAHQMYKSGNYKQALEHSSTVYEKSPLRTDNLLLLGAIYYQLHDYDMCIAKNEEALRLEPHFAECYGNMANAWKEKGDIDLAIRYYLISIELRPNFADAWSNLASAYMRKGRLNEAAQCCRQALALNPLLVDAHSNLGNLMKAQGLVQEAYSCYVEALRIQPTFAIAWSNLAGLFMESGDLNKALHYYKEAVKLKPTFPDAYLNLGNVYKGLGMTQDAIMCYQRAAQTKPNYAMAFGNLASTYYERGQVDLAILHYKQAITYDPRFVEAFNNLGNYSDAISCYNEVLRIDPTAADGLVNRGNTYKEIGRVNEAIQDYIRAINIRPTMAEAHANLASAYKDSGHVEAAIKSYKQALMLRPDFPEATCNLLHTLQCVCSWEDRDKMFKEMSVLPSVQPFHAIAYPIDPMLALEISRKYAAHCSIVASRFALPPFKHPSPVPIRKDSGGERLRIGYVSSDFGNHPLSHLMGSVFGMHNRENVEVFCYALSPYDGSEWRQRTQFEAEHFIDVSMMSSDSIAKMINDDKIHVLVNLNGYTKGARNEIFAMQPAPVQVSYMGFPGTTGATYIDYLVTDEFVSPTRYAHIYSEKLVHLPHCYFVNDYKQKNLDVLDPNCQHKRSDYGLPEDTCNILKRVPNSALWLLRFPAAGENRPLCNAHTTGTDILWAGLPMVTLPLEKMATRVAGSLCLATGLGDEMIVNSMKEYEERAVSLALDRPKLQALTNKLKAVRMTCPLFDTARWVRNLERSYFKMWNIHCSGQQPHHFKVTEDDSEMIRSIKPIHHLLPSPFTSTATTFLFLRRLSSAAPSTSKDSYFALIHHITNTMKNDLHPERTLNKLRLPVTSELVFRVLRATSSSPSASLRFFSWARLHYSPTSLELEQLLKTLARHRHFSSMWSLITQMLNPPNPFRKTNPNPQSFSLSPETVCFIIEEYGKHGLIDHSVELFHGAYALVRRMIRKGLVPDKKTYSVLVNAWCSSGKLKEAREFLEEMSRKGFNPPVRGRDLLVEGLLNAGYFESAKDMVRKMIKEGTVPDVATFNAMVETVCKSGEVEFCVDMYYGVCNLGFVPDVNSYKILIPAVSKAGRIDEAFKLLNNAIEAGHRPFPSQGSSSKSAGVYDVDHNVWTGREMTEMGLVPISRCFDMVTDGLKNCGKHDLAKRIEQLEVSLQSHWKDKNIFSIPGPVGSVARGRLF